MPRKFLRPLGGQIVKGNIKNILIVAVIFLASIGMAISPGRTQDGQKTQKEKAMEVFGIVNITSLLCPGLKLNKYAVAAMLLKAGIGQSDLAPDGPMMKANDQFALSIKDKFDHFGRSKSRFFVNLYSIS